MYDMISNLNGRFFDKETGTVEKSRTIFFDIWYKIINNGIDIFMQRLLLEEGRKKL